MKRQKQEDREKMKQQKEEERERVKRQKEEEKEKMKQKKEERIKEQKEEQQRLNRQKHINKGSARRHVTIKAQHIQQRKQHSSIAAGRYPTSPHL